MDQRHDPPAPIDMADAGYRLVRLRRHGPISCVTIPRRSYGYACAIAPWIWGRGVRNAIRQGFSAAC